ncbi:MAG: hypothetical protein KGR18_07070 [Acidobacteria bacterium]|nr:hypothetical protein [Acidobacteriota bacterium]
MQTEIPSEQHLDVVSEALAALATTDHEPCPICDLLPVEACPACDGQGWMLIRTEAG